MAHIIHITAKLFGIGWSIKSPTFGLGIIDTTSDIKRQAPIRSRETRSTTANGFATIAASTSPLRNAVQARVEPQPGHGRPVRSRIGQVYHWKTTEFEGKKKATAAVTVPAASVWSEILIAIMRANAECLYYRTRRSERQTVFRLPRPRAFPISRPTSRTSGRKVSHAVCDLPACL